nr:MAG: hypothetical protein [Microvirus sp.]
MEKVTEQQPKPAAVVPDLETLKNAAKLDLDAAIYFLQALRAHPEIIDLMVQELHRFHTETPAAIDLVTRTKDQ